MNQIQKYFRYRQSLIDQYLKGDMTKREYLERNYEAVIYSNIGPFQNVDTIEKGLYNYQYYNALAKEMKSLSTQQHLDFELKKDYQQKANYYYHKKDKATARVLKMLDFKGVKAYFIHVKSKILRGSLIEIVIEEYGMILHSTSKMLLEQLQEENVFEEGTKKSIIDGYINQRY